MKQFQKTEATVKTETEKTNILNLIDKKIRVKFYSQFSLFEVRQYAKIIGVKLALNKTFKQLINLILYIEDGNLNPQLNTKKTDKKIITDFDNFYNRKEINYLVFQNIELKNIILNINNLFTNYTNG